MKIAVTYENGEVFQHFGHTEEFKVYEVEDGKVVSSQVCRIQSAREATDSAPAASPPLSVRISRFRKM